MAEQESEEVTGSQDSSVEATKEKGSESTKEKGSASSAEATNEKGSASLQESAVMRHNMLLGSLVRSHADVSTVLLCLQEDESIIGKLEEKLKQKEDECAMLNHQLSEGRKICRELARLKSVSAKEKFRTQKKVPQEVVAGKTIVQEVVAGKAVAEEVVEKTVAEEVDYFSGGEESVADNELSLLDISYVS